MRTSRPKRSLNWRSIIAALVLCVCVVPAVQQTGAHAQSVRTSRQLLQSAAQHPNRMFKVIVQKHGVSGAPERLISSSGGKVTKNLSLIHAIAATVPGRELNLLAHSDSVNWISPDAIVHYQGGPDGTVNTTNLVNTYDQAIGADKMWANGYQGGGVNVAVVDTGISSTWDLGQSRMVASVNLNANGTGTADGYGHGTHVAGIIGGKGSMGGGQYIGIAPKSGIVNVRVFDSNGAATVSDVISGLQWISNNAAAYNIRVVNLSLDTTLNQSYNVDPLDAACETLWFNRIVVIVAGGNSQVSSPGVIDSPANDPFVITVGAIDDNLTTSSSAWIRAPFSSYGRTLDGYAKPDVSASGVDIVSILASSSDKLASQYPTHIVNSSYFDMSGTSMSTPMVAGSAALLLQTNPNLTPDQVKYRLTSTATAISSAGVGAGMVNVYNASKSTTMGSANTGTPVSQGLQTMSNNGISAWNSASWGSAYWGGTWNSSTWSSASWGSASWGSASWDSASWGSDYWGKSHHHPNGSAGGAVGYGKKTGQDKGG